MEDLPSSAAAPQRSSAGHFAATASTPLRLPGQTHERLQVQLQEAGQPQERVGRWLRKPGLVQRNARALEPEARRELGLREGGFQPREAEGGAEGLPKSAE